MSKAKKIALFYVLDGNGGAEKIEASRIRNLLKSGKVVWIHLDLSHPGVDKWLRTQSYINKWMIENLMSSDFYNPKIRLNQNRLILMLWTIYLTQKPESDDLVGLKICLRGLLLITASIKPCIDFIDINNRFREKSGPKDSYEILADILTQTLDNITLSVVRMEEAVNDIEEKIILNKIKDSHYPYLSKLLRQVIIVRKFMAPEREMIDSLIRQKEKFLSSDSERSLKDNFDRIRRIVEDIDLIEKRIRLNQDALSHLEDKKTQRNTYMLSVIAGVFLPLSYLASVFGMNLEGIPLSEESFGFLFVNIIMVLIGILILFLFKRLKWL